MAAGRRRRGSCRDRRLPHAVGSPAIRGGTYGIQGFPNGLGTLVLAAFIIGGFSSRMFVLAGIAALLVIAIAVHGVYNVDFFVEQAFYDDKHPRAFRMGNISDNARPSARGSLLEGRWRQASPPSSPRCSTQRLGGTKYGRTHQRVPACRQSVGRDPQQRRVTAAGLRERPSGSWP